VAVDTKIRVLVVDDEKLITQLVSSAVRSLGIRNITVAYNGQEAIDKFEASIKDEKPFGLIICDVDMPIVDGMQFLNKVRIKNRKVPFMMLSADKSMPSMSKAKATGADYCFLKPINVDILSLKLMAALESSSA